MKYESGLKVEQHAHSDTVTFGKHISLIVSLSIFTIITSFRMKENLTERKLIFFFKGMEAIGGVLYICIYIYSIKNFIGNLMF